MFPTMAWAAEDQGSHTLPAHENCALTQGGRAAITVTSVDGLKTAINSSANVDIVLSPASGDSATWTAAAAISVQSGKTVHLTVAEGKRVTLTRNAGAGYTLFNVANGGTLILGNGEMDYTGGFTEAVESGNYTITPDEHAGELILDGGAVWGSPEVWAPGATFGDSTGRTAVLYGEDGKQYKYTNSGNTSTRPLVTSNGTVELWDGAALKNNAMTDDGNNLSKAGSAINSSGDGSVLNLYGGEVSGCVVATNGGDTGRGAVFTGNFYPGNWNNVVTPVNAHFNMYGGTITRNAASGSGNQDGGGVSVEQGYMDLYGGEISYNHAGLWLEGANSGDGGGLMVRNYAQFHMWGGSVDHNFAGGYGGGVVAWNAELHIHGGKIAENKAAFGGGMAIASSNNANANVSAKATMDGGLIASNEAINTTTASTNSANVGIGGGICVGSGDRNMGSTLTLTGGEIRQNTAKNGGGMGVYAGGEQAEGSIRNTSVDMSGSFQLTNNFSDNHGNGMYAANTTTSNRHYLVKLSGGARIDTNNPVYFANVCTNQIPVYIGDTLTEDGTSAIFEFSKNFWSGTNNGSYDQAAAGRAVIQFKDGLDVQENKIALESTAWTLQKDNQDLVLQDLSASPRYTIRNGTPVKLNNKVYYRLYAQLSDAFAEAEDGDILYIYYNTTIDTPAVLSGKNITVMAESTSSAARDASVSGSGQTKTCWLESTPHGYDVMQGNFFKYVSSGGTHSITGGVASTTGADKHYNLDDDPDGATSYNVRNDYTITLSSQLYLGETAKGNGAQPAAVMVNSGATLEIGQVSSMGMGAGSLTFDGNSSSPKEGAMFQAAGSLKLHSGITVKNYANYSQAHPGVVEVLGGGALTMEDGVTMTGNVSPVAGAVYVANGGRFTMDGGTLSGNTGAMPRYGFFTSSDSRLAGYDTAYWGQGKYYNGAGAVYNLGAFNMNGGTISGNKGEYGALANLGGDMILNAGTLSGNKALRDTGSGTDSLAIAGYTEGADPAIPATGSTGAGNGGALYQGGGTLIVGKGITLTGNSAINGGGITVGNGQSIVRSVSRYTAVSGGIECGHPAQVPVYGGTGGVNSNVTMEVLSGADIIDNTATEQGGGVYVMDSGNSAVIESGVSLHRNTADQGGGYAAAAGGELTFSNEVTDNTARLGGGVYAVSGGTINAKGSLTANHAASGGGAYVGEGGALSLDGVLVNNNRLTGDDGFGAGVYNDGTVTLTAAGGVQPSISYNDRIYLAENRVLTLDGSYDITQSGQNLNNKLTLESANTANGTAILRAAGTAQAEATLQSGFITHYTHPLAQNVTSSDVLEINSVPIYYYDRFQGDGALGRHVVEVPYAQGDTVILQNFSVGEDEGFQSPSGKSFLYWVTIDGATGKYLDRSGNPVDTIDQAQIYYAGNTIQKITASMHLAAVYGNVQYRATLQVLDQDGDVLTSGDQPMGVIALGGASYNSSTGEYSYAMGTSMTVTADPVADAGQQTVLQGIEVYRELAATETPVSGDIELGNSRWRLVAETEMESETLDVPGGEGVQTLISTGKITGVNAHDGADAQLIDGKFVYTSTSSNILVRAQFKPAMVRLDIDPKLGEREYSGYYDTMHEAITAVAERVVPSEENREKLYTITLLRPNDPNDAANKTVLYYGERGESEANCVDNNVVDRLPEGTEICITYDLNGYTLDYQHFGERNLKRYNMTIKNGTIHYNGDRDKAYKESEDTENRGPIPSAFRVAEGTLNLEGVTIRTTEAPAEGNNDQVYSAKVMEEGTLNIGRGCTLGDVFIYTDREGIANTPVNGTDDGSGHVTVTDTFLEGRTELVATLCLRYWNFENQVRQVIKLSEDMAAREGVSIRRMFDLKDVSKPREVDSESGEIKQGEEQYWFIGTDGRLYRKVAVLVPELKLNSEGSSRDQLPLLRYWDYRDKKGHKEIGLTVTEVGKDGEPVWVGGNPIYYDYLSTYGFSREDNQVTMSAQLLDGKGNLLPMSRGNVAFIVTRLAHDSTGAILSSRRSYSGTTGVVNGAAEMDFSTLAELPVTDMPGLDSDPWISPLSYYVLSASWSGTGQYAARYAEYWNYTQGVRENYNGITGGTIIGMLRLSVQPKELAAADVRIQSVTPDQAEYVGPAGRAMGNTSSPTVGRVVDSSLGHTMIPGTDYNVYYAALTDDVSKAVLDADGRPIIVHTRLQGMYYYLASDQGGKTYYSIGGAGEQTGYEPANAKDLNGAPAGPYSVALESETLTDSNYVGQSGWKKTVFTIRPYSGVLSLESINHVVVGPEQNYADVLTTAFNDLKDKGELAVADQNGNQLSLESCAFKFLPASGKAELDEDGWPKSEGLYNLEVTVSGHANGTMHLDGVGSSLDPNYAVTAAGYRTILITNKPLNVFFVPETISVPYTGEIYNSDMMKKLDSAADNGYQVWRCRINAKGRPLNDAGEEIAVDQIPNYGAEKIQLDTTQYRVEIGSPRNTPQNVGSYTMVVTDVTGSYVGIGTLSIKTEQFNSIQLSETSSIYTGVDHSPIVTVRDTKGNDLTLNRDYVLRITNMNNVEVDAPINAGDYIYTAQGINNYSGASIRTTYNVRPKALDNSDVTDFNNIRNVILDAPNYAIYSNVAVAPRYALYYNGISLVRGDSANADYTQTISKGLTPVEVIQTPGEYTFTITGKGNYTGSRIFVLNVVGAGENEKLQITNTSEYTYNGQNFESYRWLNSANVTKANAEGTLHLDAEQFDVAIEKVSGSTMTHVDINEPLDAGVYCLTLHPTEEYAQLTSGLEVDDYGTCVFQVQRRPVTITVNAGEKYYGETDPVASGYKTDLVGSDPETGFFQRDKSSITGHFSRNTGEDVRNGGYRYMLGSFSAGDNYVLSVDLTSMFEILPRDISEPYGGEEDLFRLEKRDYLSYTGYGLQPIQSMTYQSQRGNLALVPQANYALSYARWRSDGEGCTPDCTLVHNHGWESVAGQPTDVGWYEVLLDADACITSPDNYVGSRSFLFEIRAQGGELGMRVEGDDKVTYRKDGYNPVVTVSREGFELNQDYYTMSYSFAPAGGGTVRTGEFRSAITKFTDAGEYTIYAAGSGNYTGSAGSVSFTIQPKNIAQDDLEGAGVAVEARLKDGQSFVYNGSAQQAEVAAYYEGEDESHALQVKTDYTLSYQNHVNAGTATVVLTGRGNYTGTRTLNYTIAKQPLKVTVTGGATKTYGSADPSYTYKVTGEGDRAVDVHLNGAAGRDAGEDVGAYRLNIGNLSAGGNYDLTMAEDAFLTIAPKSLGKGSAPAQNINPQTPAYVAAGSKVSVLKGQLSVTYWAPTLGETALTHGTDYTVTVADESGNTINEDAELAGGTYTLTVEAVEGQGKNYTGSFSVTVTAVSADSLITLGEGKTLTYRLKPQTQVLTPTVGGEVLKDCSIVVTANYTKGGTLTSYPTQDESGTFSVTMTDAGIYTVVVTHNEGGGEGGNVYFGTVTYVVQPKDITKDNTAGGGAVTLKEPEGDFSYTGEAVYPTNANALLLYDGATEPIPATVGNITNYIVGYSNNVNPGIATVTVYGQGNYTGTQSTTFQVGEIRYHAAYDKNGATTGTVPQDNGLYMSGDRITVMSNEGDLKRPEADKVVFLGWSDAQLPDLTDRGNYDIYVSGSSYLVEDHDVTLYAVWALDENRNGKADCDEDKYTVEYSFSPADECSGSVPVDGKPYLGGATVPVQPNVGNLALKGYLLLGWAPMAEQPARSLALNTSEEFFTFVSENSLYSPERNFSMGSANVELYAVWGADANNNGTVDWMETEVQYFLSYDANGGAGDLPASTALRPGELGAIVAPGFDSAGLTRFGYRLLGWSATKHDALTAAPGADMELYQPDDPYSIDPNTVDPVVVFYAVWAVDENRNSIPDYEETRHDVTYANACAGVEPLLMPEADQEKLPGVSVILPKAEGTIKEGNVGATFLGWTNDADQAKEVYLQGKAPKDVLTAGSLYEVGEENVTLYAVWGETNYNVARYTVTVTPSPVGGGTVKAEPATILSGGSSAISIEVNDGYALGQVMVNGRETNATVDETGRTAALELTDIAADQSVVVTFVRSQFRVAWPNPVTYNQQKQTPTLTVYRSDNTDTAVPAANYEYSVAYNGTGIGDVFTKAGSYTITVKGKGEYAGSEVLVPYIINYAPLTGLTLKDVESRPYKGEVYTDEIHEVKAGELIVPAVRVDAADGYTALYSENKNVGTATVLVVGQGNYTGSQRATFEITPASAGSMDASWTTEPGITYDGQPHNPVPTVKQGDTVLTENLDYTVEYTQNDKAVTPTAAGSYTVKITGKGNFDGVSTTIGYTIKPKSLAQNDTADGTKKVVSLEIPDQEYTGSVLTPGPILTYGDNPVLTLTKDTDYDLAYHNNVNVSGETSKATVTVTGKGNYTGEQTLEFRIVAAGSALTAASKVEKTYNGRGQLLSKDDLKVKMGDTALETTDYDVSYTALSEGAPLVNGEPKAAGTYVALITAKGSYSGTAQTTLIMKPATIDKPTTEGSAFIYDGEAHTPEIRAITAEGGSVSVGTDDYSVTYKDNTGAISSNPPTEVGSYTMIVTGQGNFAGEEKVYFTINVGDALLAENPGDQVYNGLPYQPRPKVTSGGRELKENRDYTLTYPTDVTNVEKGDDKRKTVTISGIGNYAGAAASSFTYSITAKNLQDDNIEILVADQIYDGQVKTPTPVVIYHPGDGRNLFLTKDTDYTVVYENNTAAGTAKATLTGIGNYAGTKEKAFTITATAGKGLTVKATPTTIFTYNGKEQAPTTVVVKDGEKTLSKGTDYELSYETVSGSGTSLGANGKPVNAGVYNLVVTGKNNYAGASGKVTLTINPAPLGTLSLSETALTYNGQKQSLADDSITVKNAANAPLTKDTDYTVTYLNNQNAGTASVVITGKGNYTGTLMENFTIEKAALTITTANTEKTYGEADGLNYTVDPSAVTGYALEGALSRVVGENVKENGYAINLGTLRETTGNYKLVLAGEQTFQILPKSIGPGADSLVTRNKNLTVGYTGSAFDRAVSTIYQTSWGPLHLVNGTDCDVAYTQDGNPVAAPTAPGVYTGTVTGKGNYTGYYTFTLEIVRVALGVSYTDTVTYDGSNWAADMHTNLTVYANGAAVPSLTAGNLTFKQGDTVLTNKEMRNAGDYTIVVRVDNYDSVELPFTIQPKTLTAGMVSEPDDQTYTGSALEPAVTVTDGDLLKAADYKVTYRANTKAGTADVVVTGQNNYTGTVTRNFTIVPETVTITPTNTEKDYGAADGDLTYNASSTVNGFHIEGTLTRASGEEKGEYDFHVSTLRETTGNYTLALAAGAKFTISPKSIEQDTAGITHSGDLTAGYTGVAFDRAVPTVYASGWGNLDLVKDRDYTVTYTQNGDPATPTEPGIYTATVTGIGNYTGSYSVKLTVVKAVLGVAFETAGDDTVTYDGTDWVSGMAEKLDVYASGAAVPDLTADNLTFKKDGTTVDEMIDAGAYTIVVDVAGYNPVELPFTILPKTLTAGMVTDPAGGTYTGGALTPEAEVTDGAASMKSTDYTVTYRNNINAGMATVVVTGKNNYTGTVEKEFSIGKKPLQAVDILAELTYNGMVQAPNPVAVGPIAGVDYDLTYTRDGEVVGPVTVGTYKVTATAVNNGNYSGTVESEYRITPRDLVSHGALTVSPAEMTYTGSELEPMALVTDGAVQLVEGTDYDLSYEADSGELGTNGKPQSAGTYTVKITGKNNYMNELSKTFAIKAMAGKRLTVTAPSTSFTYNGEEQSIEAEEIVVKDGETALTLNTDYTLSYEAVSGTLGDNGEPLNAGVYNLVVTGIGNYDGTVEHVSVIINPAGLGEISLAEGELTYNGSEQKCPVTVNGATLSESNEDYEVVYKNNEDAGMASVTITGKDNYAGAQTLTFRIQKAELVITPTKTEKIYGEADELGYSAASEMDDYVLEGALSRAVGENVKDGGYAINLGTLRETSGNYELKLEEGKSTFTISPKSIGDSETAAEKITATGDLNVGYTGNPFNQTISTVYQTNWGPQNLLNGTDCAVTYQKADGTAVTGIPKDAGIYIGTVTGKDGGNYTGVYTFKLTISRAVLGVTYGDTVTYNGSNWADNMAGRLNASFQGTAVALTDDNLSFERDGETVRELIDAGTYTIVVTTADYDALELPFTILPKTLTAGMVTDPASGTYTGSALEPAVTVTDGDLLKAADYEMTYQDNINAGSAAVTVNGRNNYTGTVTKTFTIAPATVTITPTKTGKTYGTADGTLTYDALSAVNGFDVQGTLTREPGEEKGEYAFIMSMLRETTGNYTLALAAGTKFVISPKSIALNSENISHSGNLSAGYTGETFDRSVPTMYASSWGNLNLTKGTDYNVTYTQNGDPAEPNAAGAYTGTVNGMGNYTGSYTFVLTIAKAVLGVTYTDTVTYDGSNWAAGMKDRITASFNGTGVSLDDATLTFRKGSGSVTEMVNAGSYTLVLSVDDYDTLELPFTILPKTLTDGMVSEPDDQTYTGSALEPAVTVADGDLLKATDYEVSCQSNTNAGAAAVIVTGKGNYTGMVTKTFTITKKALTEPDVSVGSLTDHIYNGQLYQPRPQVKNGQRVLLENVDYTLSYAGDLTNNGTVTVTVDGTGNYSGTLTRSYQITAKALQRSWLTVLPAAMTYTGAELKPMVLVANGEVRLIEGTDYDVTYANNITTGTATVTVKGKGNYTGEISGTFRIISNMGGLTAALSSGEAGYTGEDQKPTLTVMAGGAPTEEYTATYTYNGGEPQPFNADAELADVGIYTITVSGRGNYASATVVTLFTIRPATFTVGAVDAQDYTGGPVTPKPTVTGNGKTLTEHKDYVLTYANNVALGENTALITVTGLGNYAGAEDRVAFTITGENTLYHVTYEGNGMTAGTLPVDDHGYLAEEQATILNGTGLIRTGAMFLGWSRSRSDLVTTRAKQDEIALLQPGSSLTLRGDMTLYAVWAEDKNHNSRPDYAEEVTINASAGEGGTISPSGKNTVAWGTQRVEYTITVDSGYTFSGLTVDGQKVALSTQEAPTALTKTGAGYTYVFTDVRTDHVILATFQKNSSGGSSSGGGFLPGKEPDPPQTGLPYPPNVSGIDRYLIIGDHTAYVYGRESGFEPNASITRAEAAVMLYRMLKNKNVPITVSFVDVPEDAWYTTAALTLASMGLIKGVGGNCFDPNRNITRQEFATIVARMAYKVNKDVEAREYIDVSPDDWFYESVRVMSYYGWMKGYPDGTFGAGWDISRAEAVKVLNHMTCRFYDQKTIDAGAGKRFNDVSEGHWAFYEIIEASTTHDFTQYGDVETWTKES